MEALIKSLAVVLANIYIFSIKCQGFHWNVTGADFYQLHLLFERIYGEAYEEVDRVAEHIRGYGFVAPGSAQMFITLSTLEETGTVPAATQMVGLLLTDVDAVIGSIDAAAAEAVGWQGTLNILGDLVEKFQSFKFLLQASQ